MRISQEVLRVPMKVDAQGNVYVDSVKSWSSWYREITKAANNLEDLEVMQAFDPEPKPDPEGKILEAIELSREAARDSKPALEDINRQIATHGESRDYRKSIDDLSKAIALQDAHRDYKKAIEDIGLALGMIAPLGALRRQIEDINILLAMAPGRSPKAETTTTSLEFGSCFGPGVKPRHRRMFGTQFLIPQCMTGNWKESPMTVRASLP
jgi:hypothetical protein